METESAWRIREKRVGGEEREDVNGWRGKRWMPLAGVGFIGLELMGLGF